MFKFIEFIGFRKRLVKAMETYHRLDDPWSATHVKPVIEKYLESHVEEGDQTLELGSGDGVITEVLTRWSKSIDCVEISKKAIEKAKKRSYDADIHFHHKDIHSFHIHKEYDLTLFSFIVDYLGFDKFPKKFVWLMMQITKRSKKIVIIQPVHGEENLKSLHRMVLILNQFDFIESHKEINTDTSPDLFMGTYERRPQSQAK